MKTPDPETTNGAASALSPWWRIGDFGVLGLWMVVVSFTISYHEKWADEAQSWLIARDLDLRTIWFHELRYEGTPGLWHTILWVAQHLFRAKYDTIGYIGMAGAAAGVALLIFKAPFPRIIRWPLAFTYVMVYQYAVIARQYTLLPLLAFAAAALFKDIRHPERMTVVLVLLANLSVHGAILCRLFGFGLPGRSCPLVAHSGGRSADALPDLLRRDGSDFLVPLHYLKADAGHRCLRQK